MLKIAHFNLFFKRIRFVSPISEAICCKSLCVVLFCDREFYFQLIFSLTTHFRALHRKRKPTASHCTRYNNLCYLIFEKNRRKVGEKSNPHYLIQLGRSMLIFLIC